MVRPWLKLIRLPNALVAGLGTWLGHACLPGPVDWAAAAIGSAAMALLAAGGNAHNDLLDLAADRVNRPDRPLPSGRISLRAAAWTAGILYAASFAAAFALGPAQGYLTLGMGFLLALYNVRLKALPLAGNLAVALLCAFAVYFPEFPGGPVHTGIPALFALLTTMAREIAKDAEDMPGDRAVGWKTFPIAFGPAPTRAAVAALALITLALLPIPALVPADPPYHRAYWVLAALGPAALLVWCLRGILSREPRWGRIQRGLKWIMLAGMISILAGVRL